MEVLSQIIAPILVILVTILTIYQTIILRTQVTKQKDIIKGMESYQSIIKLDEVQKYVSMREETITLQTEKEKKDSEEKFKKLFEAKDNDLTTTQLRLLEAHSEFNEKMKHLKNTEQRLKETEDTLRTAYEDIINQNAQIKFYLDTNSELLNLAIRLTATYIHKDKWNELADEYTKEVNGLFKETLNVNGVEILEKLREREVMKRQITASLIGRNTMAKKLFKGIGNYNPPISPPDLPPFDEHDFTPPK
jgi:hypothetical protein